MAQNTAKKSTSTPEQTVDVERAESYAKAHRDRRVDEPAAASPDTDADVGGDDRRPVPDQEPADTYMVNSGGEARAGPGDAGRADAPRVLDNPQDKAPRSNKALLIGIAGGVVIMLLLLLFTG